MCEASSGHRDRLLLELIESVGNSLNLQETLADLERRLRLLIVFQTFAVWLPREDRLVPRYVRGPGPIGEGASRFLCAQEIPLAESLAGRVAAAHPPALPEVLSIRLENGSGLIGVLALYSEIAFEECDRQLLQKIRRKTVAAIANAVQWERLERLAAVDPESSLPNQRGLFLCLDAEMARARRTRTPVGVIVCDAGNAAVRWPAIANELRQICREEDCVARMGDAIVLVLAGLVRSNLPEKQRRIATLLAKNGLASAIGAAFYPDDGGDADDLLAIAGERRSRGMS